MSDIPQFGARADQVEGQYGPPDDPNSRPYEAGQPQRDTASQQTQPGYQQSQGKQPQVGYPSAGNYQQSANGYQQAGIPMYPQGNCGGGIYSAVKLPGRGWSIATIIIGLLMMFVVPLGVFVASVVTSYSGLEPENIANTQVKNGDMVTLKDQGIYVLSVKENQSSVSCVMDEANGNAIVPNSSQVNAGVLSFTWQELGPGDFKVNCKMRDGKAYEGQILTMDQSQIINLATPLLKSLIAPTIVAIVGLFVMIGGIVWLVRVNRKRRAIQMGRY